MRILRKIRNKYTEVKRMKYIVSGCTGHLGLNLVKYLLSAGKTVKAIALPGENTEKLSEHGADVVYGDVTDRDFVFSQVEQGCVFFHLAGVIDITSGNKDKVYLVNVKGTENVADAFLFLPTRSWATTPKARQSQRNTFLKSAGRVWTPWCSILRA